MASYNSMSSNNIFYNGSNASQPTSASFSASMNKVIQQDSKPTGLYHNTKGNGFANAPWLEHEASKGLSLLNSPAPQYLAYQQPKASIGYLITPEVTLGPTPEKSNSNNNSLYGIAPQREYEARNIQLPQNYLTNLDDIVEGGYVHKRNRHLIVNEGPLFAPTMVPMMPMMPKKRTTPPAVEQFSDIEDEVPAVRTIQAWRNSRIMGQPRNKTPRKIINKAQMEALIKNAARKNTAFSSTGCYLKRNHDEYIDSIQATGELPIPGQEKPGYTTDLITSQVRKRLLIDDDAERQNKRYMEVQVQKYYKKQRKENEEAWESGPETEQQNLGTDALIQLDSVSGLPNRNLPTQCEHTELFRELFGDEQDQDGEEQRKKLEAQLEKERLEKEQRKKLEAKLEKERLEKELGEELDKAFEKIDLEKEQERELEKMMEWEFTRMDLEKEIEKRRQEEEEESVEE